MNIQDYCYNKKFNYIYPLSTGLIVILILFQVINYLNKLENCDCFNNNAIYNKYKIDIEFLKAYQWLEIFITLIFIYLIFTYREHICKKMKKPHTNSKFLTFLSMIIIPLLLFLSGYISYNSFLLYLTSKKKCKCSDKWQKYYIYFQGIMGFIMLFRFVFLFLFVVLLIMYASFIGNANK